MKTFLIILGIIIALPILYIAASAVLFLRSIGKELDESIGKEINNK